MAVLSAFQQILVQLIHNILDLVSHGCSLSAIDTSLPGLLPSIQQLSLSLHGLLTVGLQSFLALLLSSLVSHLLLSGQNILQRLGCFQTKELLIVGADAVGGLLSLKLEVTDSLGILRSLGEGQILDLLVQLAELALLGIDEVNLALVLLNLLSLNIVLGNPIKGICQQRTVGDGINITVRVRRGIIIDIRSRLCYIGSRGITCIFNRHRIRCSESR